MHCLRIFQPTRWEVQNILNKLKYWWLVSSTLSNSACSITHMLAKTIWFVLFASLYRCFLSSDSFYLLVIELAAKRHLCGVWMLFWLVICTTHTDNEMWRPPYSCLIWKNIFLNCDISWTTIWVLIACLLSQDAFCGYVALFIVIRDE